MIGSPFFKMIAALMEKRTKLGPEVEGWPEFRRCYRTALQSIPAAWAALLKEPKGAMSFSFSSRGNWKQTKQRF